MVLHSLITVVVIRCLVKIVDFAVCRLPTEITILSQTASTARQPTCGSIQGSRRVILKKTRLITEVTRLLGMTNGRLRSKGYI